MLNKFRNQHNMESKRREIGSPESRPDKLAVFCHNPRQIQNNALSEQGCSKLLTLHSSVDGGNAPIPATSGSGATKVAHWVLSISNIEMAERLPGSDIYAVEMRLV
jgi:hypothetical protein